MTENIPPLSERGFHNYLQVIDNPFPGKGPQHYYAEGFRDALFKPGACWRCPEADDPDRECWVIVLPNGAGVWWTTMRSDPEKFWPPAPDGRWTITGDMPIITVTPSINSGEGGDRERYGWWHGFITSGRFQG